MFINDVLDQGCVCLVACDRGANAGIAWSFVVHFHQTTKYYTVKVFCFSFCYSMFVVAGNWLRKRGQRDKRNASRLTNHALSD